MNQPAIESGYFVDMEKKDLTAAMTLYFIGGMFFLHRAYLGDFRPTVLTVCGALVFWGARNFIQGSVVLLILALIVLVVWIGRVIFDLGKLPERVERRNAQLLEKFK